MSTFTILLYLLYYVYVIRLLQTAYIPYDNLNLGGIVFFFSYFFYFLLVFSLQLELLTWPIFWLNILYMF